MSKDKEGAPPASEPVAQMLERWELELKLSTDGDTIWYGHALPFLTDAAPRLLGLVRAGEALAVAVRTELECTGLDHGEAHDALSAWDEASRGAGQRGEGTNG